MPYFTVTLKGRGIRLAVEGDGDDHPSEPAIGFYLVQHVFARDPEKAIRKATAIVNKLWSKPPFSNRNTGNLPELSVDEIREISFLKGLFSRKRLGNIFYQED